MRLLVGAGCIVDRSARVTGKLRYATVADTLHALRTAA
jgi:hypothetical protein